MAIPAKPIPKKVIANNRVAKNTSMDGLIFMMS
jgi:hypothetical protein